MQGGLLNRQTRTDDQWTARGSRTKPPALFWSVDPNWACVQLLPSFSLVLLISGTRNPPQSPPTDRNLWSPLAGICLPAVAGPGDQTVQDLLPRCGRNLNPAHQLSRLLVEMLAVLVSPRVGHEAACPAAVQEPASVPQRAESGGSGQTLQPPGDMSGCLQVARPRPAPAPCAGTVC